MSLLNCEIYQRERVFRVATTKLVLHIAHLNRLPGGGGVIKKMQVGGGVVTGCHAPNLIKVIPYSYFISTEVFENRCYYSL